jgi:prefoldin subunit 5
MSAAVPAEGKNATYFRLMTEGKNPRGIPGAKFIDNVEQFLKDEQIESVLGAMNELYSKYKYMEGSIERSRSIYKGKIPELEQTLELVKLMKMKLDNDEEMHTNFSLCDTIYAKAKVDLSKEKVVLYVGAKILIEYTYDEAQELLGSQLESTFEKVKELDEDLAFLRNNTITTEVNMSRLFNYSVKLKQAAKA